MLWLAFRTLVQERGRLIITLIGIAFSTLLTVVEVAMYLGMMGNATGVIRHADAGYEDALACAQEHGLSLPMHGVSGA